MKKLSTKECIAQTMFEFLQNNRIESITVSQVAQEVGVSTKTFYNCFRDKYDVCNYLYDRLLMQRCWYTDNQRCSLSEFFENLMDAIAGDYSLFFQNTMCYKGQSCLGEYIVEHGIEDLKLQLRLTGHENMITPQTIQRLTFYMRGLSASLDAFIASGKAQKEDIIMMDKTQLLPQKLYDALTAPLIDPNS